MESKRPGTEGRTKETPTSRERWERSLLLDSHSDLRESLVRELAEYSGRTEEEVAADCRRGAESLAEEWRSASPATSGEVAAFYEKTGAYLYDLTWWHALAEDDSAALAGVEALDAALERRAREVLDFGAGIGSLGVLLARHGLEVTLAEVNSSLSEYARRRFERRGLEVRFLEPGSLPESAFDFVSAVDVLEHLPNPGETLKALAAALRPGGALFVHLPPEEDASRPMHLWHGPEKLLEHLEGAGLWLESASGASMTLRRGEAPLYSLKPGFEVRSTKRGGLLLSERPLMAVRLNSRAAGMLALLEEERPASELAGESGLSPAEATAFLDGLVARRVVERRSGPAPVRWPSVSIVVPARGRPSETRACAESLLALDYPPELLEVLVVDDASEVPLSESLSDLPMRVLRLEENVGQSAARNIAAREAKSEVLAFTDNDCVAEPGWLRALVAPLCEPGVDASGGRVLSPPPDGPVSAFEEARSPLDMGETGSAVGHDEAVPYLPTCNLAVDRKTLLGLGGFDEEMKLGEDADFVWRVASSGKGVRYEPGAGVVHRHRTRLLDLLRRRAEYASSEADLQRRHPQTRRRMMVPAAGTLLLSASPLYPLSWTLSAAAVSVAVLLVFFEAVSKSRKLRDEGAEVPEKKVVAAILRQHGASLYYLGGNVARYYSLPLLAVSLLWPALLPPALLLMAVPAVVDHRRLSPKTSLASFVILYWLELSAYQIGVWRGCLKRRTLRPLLPIVRLGR